MASRERSCRLCGACWSSPKTRCPECGAQEDAPNDPMIGRRLGPYLLQRKIAEGGIAAIYEASNGDLRVAVKILPTTHDEELKARFRREATVLRQLAHPFALKLYEHGETQERLSWLAMEFLDGETLGARLARGTPLSPTELVSIFGPICEILEEAHQRGIIHRDLTPENIMLTHTKEGVPRVTPLDFGFAWLRGEKTLTEQGVVSGTPQYMPPEQWGGLHNTDARSDLYSLGVILYQCLSGRLPLEAKSPLEWLLLHERAKPTDLSLLVRGLSPKLSAVVMKALSKEPSARQSSARLLQEELLAALDATL